MVKKRKTQTQNHTTEIKPLTNLGTWSEFTGNEGFMFFPSRDDWRKRFIFSLMEWASKEDSVEIVDFALEMRMRRQTIYYWANEYPDIMAALNQARLMIGSRRRKGALTKKFDKDVVFKDMHKYDPEWLEINKYHSDIKKEEEKQSHTFIINTVKPRIVSKEEMQSDSEKES